MRISILLASVLICASSTAQIVPERYLPFEPGDVRTYAVRSGSCSPLVLREYHRNEVLRDTVVAGEVYSVASCTILALNGDRLGRSVYMVRPSNRFRLIVQEILSSGGCSLTQGREAHYTSEQTDVEVEIGELNYSVAGLYNTYQSTSGSSGAYSSNNSTALADIGLFEYDSYYRGSTNAPPYCSNTNQRLVYAAVSGLVYGANPVTDEGGAPAAQDLAISALPSLARQTTSLHISAASPENVRVEAFDLLGRRMYIADAPPGTLRLDVSAWPTGLYVVRAMADGAAVTARLVVSR